MKKCGTIHTLWIDFKGGILGNELVLLDKNASMADMMNAIGQGQSFQSKFSRLSINKNGEDDQGRAIKPGSYAVWSKEENDYVYSKLAQFRPLLSKYQYRVFDNEANATTNRTIQFGSWNDEIIDELGGFKCGKITGKAALKLPPDLLEMQKKIKCYRYLYGLLSGDFTPADSTKIVKMVDVPVVWRMRGLAFQAVGEVMDTLTKQKRIMFNFAWELTTTRQTKGSNIYYIPIISVIDNYLQLEESNIVLYNEFQEVVDVENSEITEKYNSATKKITVTAQEKAIVDAIDVPFNDVIPEDMGVESTEVAARA